MPVCSAVTQELEGICSTRVSVAIPVLQPVDEHAKNAFSKFNAPEDLVVDPMTLVGILSDQDAGYRRSRETDVDQPIDASLAFGLGFLP